MQVEVTVVLEQEVPYAELDVRLSLYMNQQTGELDIYTIEVQDIVTGLWHVLKNEYGPVSIAAWRYFNTHYDDLVTRYEQEQSYYDSPNDD